LRVLVLLKSEELRRPVEDHAAHPGIASTAALDFPRHDGVLCVAWAVKCGGRGEVCSWWCPNTDETFCALRSTEPRRCRGSEHAVLFAAKRGKGDDCSTQVACVTYEPYGSACAYLRHLLWFHCRPHCMCDSLNALLHLGSLRDSQTRASYDQAFIHELFKSNLRACGTYVCARRGDELTGSLTEREMVVRLCFFPYQ
jgi:hypothetical protein